MLCYDMLCYDVSANGSHRSRNETHATPALAGSVTGRHPTGRQSHQDFVLLDLALAYLAFAIRYSVAEQVERCARAAARGGHTCKATGVVQLGGTCCGGPPRVSAVDAVACRATCLALPTAVFDVGAAARDAASPTGLTLKLM